MKTAAQTSSVTERQNMACGVVYGVGGGTGAAERTTMEIQSGDRVYLHLPGGASPYCYRVVRSADGDKINVYHLGQIVKVNAARVLRVVNKIGSTIRGINTLSETMYQKGIRNEDLSDKSGYSIGTVDRARRGLRVKPATLQDLHDSVAQL